MHELTFKNSKLDSRNDTWNNKSSKLVRTGLTSKVDSSLERSWLEYRLFLKEEIEVHSVI
jgi:hypothetical protein